MKQVDYSTIGGGVVTSKFTIDGVGHSRLGIIVCIAIVAALVSPAVVDLLPPEDPRLYARRSERQRGVSWPGVGRRGSTEVVGLGCSGRGGSRVQHAAFTSDDVAANGRRHTYVILLDSNEAECSITLMHISLVNYGQTCWTHL